MTNDTSPRPWHIGESICGTMSCIYDANGEHIASCFGMPTEADAALIVDAVNGIDATKKLSIQLYDPIRRAEAERDRLRDIVKRMADYAETYHALGVQGKQLVAEARAAIGEGEK